MSFNWTFPITDANAVSLFSKAFDFDTYQKTTFADLIYQMPSPDVGKMPKSKLTVGPIKRHVFGPKERLAQITFMNIGQLSQPGVYGDLVAAGTAEPTNVYSQTATFDQYAKVLHSDGLLSEKRVLADWRETAKRQLSDFMAVFMDESINIALIGESVFNNSNYFHYTSGQYTQVMGNALKSTDSNHIVYAGNATTNATAQNASQVVTAQLLTKLVITATQTLTIPIRELPKLPSGAKFLYLDDMNVIAQLGYDSDWRTAQITGNVRGDKNEALSMSIGAYGGVEVLAQTRAFRPIANVAYGMLLGADALNILLVEPWKWYEGYEDYNRKKVIMVSSMFGVVPTYFNGSKRNMLMVPHYVAT
jgi:hypothetical protein